MKKNQLVAGLGFGLLLFGGVSVYFVTPRENANRTPDNTQSNRSSDIQKQISSPLNSKAQSSAPVANLNATTLTQAQKTEFYKDVDFVFGKLAVAGLDKEVMGDHLSRLNRSGRAGVEALAQTLATPTIIDTEVRQRISMVDYLLYRARWDEFAKQKVVELAALEIPNTVPAKYRGAVIAERAELLGGLAKLDWSVASGLLANISDPLLRKYASSEATFNLAQSGMTFEQATLQVRKIIPETKI